MVLQSWVIGCLKMYKISSEIIKFIENTMKMGESNWQQKEKA